MSLQSQALGFPHLVLNVREPYREAYRRSILSLMRSEGIRGLVTGDISVEDHRLWMKRVCSGLGIDLIMPLWRASSIHLLYEIALAGFHVIFTCVKKPWFDERWVGRQLNRDCLRELEEVHRQYGIDLCGENGEYHTMVLDGPIFGKTIRIEESSREKENSMFYLKVRRLSLHCKPVSGNT
jgi:uncharacterized protein (TIGR00290 family)